MTVTPPVARLLHRHAADRDAAADCVQDVFVIAATRLVQLREPDRLGPGCTRSRSEALARIRARRRELPSEGFPRPTGGRYGYSGRTKRSVADLIALPAASCPGATGWYWNSPTDRSWTDPELAEDPRCHRPQRKHPGGAPTRDDRRSAGALLRGVPASQRRPGALPRTGRHPRRLARRTHGAAAQTRGAPHRELLHL